MLVDLPVVEQRYLAVRAVLDGAQVSDVASQLGVSRQSVHAWVVRYERAGLAGLADRSHRPRSCPHQTCAELEALICELRRQHPRWGGLRILLELKRRRLWDGGFPSKSSVNRVLARHGLLVRAPRRRRRSEFIRWERPAPMLLWQLDIVEGPKLVNPRTGELRPSKIITGVDDHARFCVIAKVVERATGRAVCTALVAALETFGVPEEILTDNGKQFTGRFGRPPTEVLFERICRRNGITQRLIKPRSPTTTGKIERFHRTLEVEFLDQTGPFPSLAEAQAALDGWVGEYNTDRPHQALNTVEPVTPAERFAPVPDCERALLPLWIPPNLTPVDGQRSTDHQPLAPSSPTAVEFERVVPASGNMWLEAVRSGSAPPGPDRWSRFWADSDMIHVLAGGARIKTLRSYLSSADLQRLTHRGARPAGPSPLPPADGHGS